MTAGVLGRVFALVAMTACSIPTPPSPPPMDPPTVEVTTGCTREASDLAEIEGVVRRTARVDLGDRPSLVRELAPAISRMLAGSALRTSTGEPAVALPASDRALVDWWDRRGGAWIAMTLSNLRKPDRIRPMLTIPPTMRSVADPTRVAAEVLCPDGPCDREAEDFILEDAQNGLLFEAYLEGRAHGTYRFAPKRLYGAWPVDFDPLPHGCPEDDYASWAMCVTEHRSVRPAFAIGDYRMPRDGWLFVNTELEKYDPCHRFVAVDLATGAAIWTRGCVVLWGRADLQRAREFALIAALAETVEEVVEFHEVEVPQHLAGEPRCSLGSTPPPFVRLQDRRHYKEDRGLRVWWANRGRIVLDVTLAARPEDAGARMAVRLFTIVDHSLVVGGARPAVPDLARVADEQLAAHLRRVHPELSIMTTDRCGHDDCCGDTMPTARCAPDTAQDPDEMP